LGAIKPQFFLGILLAALGGCLVTLYKPTPAPKPALSSARLPENPAPRH
jgi:hypothetical protein